MPCLFRFLSRSRFGNREGYCPTPFPRRKVQPVHPGHLQGMAPIFPCVFPFHPRCLANRNIESQNFGRMTGPLFISFCTGFSSVVPAPAFPTLTIATTDKNKTIAKPVQKAALIAFFLQTVCGYSRFFIILTFFISSCHPWFPCAVPFSSLLPLKPKRPSR